MPGSTCTHFSEEPRKGYTSSRAPQGKGLTEMFPANHVLHHREENTDDQNRLCCRTQHGVPGGVELGIIPIPSFPSPRPPPSPGALDCYGSRGYDRAVARARYLLGILELWISQPIAWMQQGLEDGVEMCRALDWEEPYLPRTEIGRVGFKTWCTDKCLNAHCLDRWGLFHRLLLGSHISTVFTSCGWWRAKIFPMRDSQLATPGHGALQEASAPGHGGG